MAERNEDSIDPCDDLQQRMDDGNEPPKEMFRQASNVAVLLSYDLVDKLRWWEKDTLELSDEEVLVRLEHMSTFLTQLRTAYLTFTEADL